MKALQNFKVALTAVSLLWLVHLLNLLVPVDLRFFGLRPRLISGLQGIVFAPFLHHDIVHLIANTGALLMLLTISLSISRKLTILALLIIACLGGGLVWLFALSDAVHIGASGVIFGLIGFLVFLGFFREEWKTLLFSLAVLFLYGGAFFALLTPVAGVSWTGHFFGFLSGVMAAWWMRATKIN